MKSSCNDSDNKNSKPPFFTKVDIQGTESALDDGAFFLNFRGTDPGEELSLDSVDSTVVKSNLSMICRLYKNLKGDSGSHAVFQFAVSIYCSFKICSLFFGKILRISQTCSEMPDLEFKRLKRESNV